MASVVLGMRRAWRIAAAFVVVLMFSSAFTVVIAGGKGPPPRFTEDELGFIASIDDDYAWSVTEHLLEAGRVVAGTEKALTTAEWIKNQMTDVCGLDESLVYIEEFPIVGWNLDESTAGYSVGRTQLDILVGGAWVNIPAVQCDKGDGTGPDGRIAEIVDVQEGKLKDFEKLGEDGVRGKIVLFTRTDVMFYCIPVLHMAADRGAVGAICHLPKTPDHELKIDISDGSLPLVYITDNDAAMIRSLLTTQTVVADLVVDNDYDEVPLSSGYNVVGMIEGVELPEEYVYVGAHLDHWFTSAADDNAGIGSLLSMAKAFTDSGFKPKRSIVFVVFDSEELGGWQDTWYDWCMGSYAHIVETLTGEVLNRDRPGKIVAMFNMDVIGTDGAIVYVESTPDLTRFAKKAAFDSGLIETAPMTYVYWPPSSYDDWPFYMAGVPCTETAWWGEEYDKLYHTTGDTMESLNPAYVRVNTVFNGLMTIRMAQAIVLPYNLPENIEVIESGIELLYIMDPDASTMTDLSSLEAGLDAYTYQVDRLLKLIDRKKIDTDYVNKKMMESAVALNPVMFDWDLTAWIPGWTGIFILDNPGNDLHFMKSAISALQDGDGETALDMLTQVTTMRWGRFVDYASYQSVMEYIYYVPEDHLLWGQGFLPPHSDVHQEYFSIEEKMEDGVPDFSAEIASLEQLVETLYGEIDTLSDELAIALSDAAAVLAEIR